MFSMYLPNLLIQLIQKNSYLPVFVMIISVPNSLNLSHSSFVSKLHCMCLISSLDHRSANCGLRGGGERAREPLALPLADPASDVEDTSTGESRSYSAKGGDGDPDADAAASTNFSERAIHNISMAQINQEYACYVIASIIYPA